MCDPTQCQTAATSVKHSIGTLSVYTNPVMGKGSLFADSKKIKAKSNAAVLKTTFHANVEQDGNYYFLVSTLSTYLANNQFQEISVYVNGQYQGILDNSHADWEIIGIKDKPTILLEKGDNEIIFATAQPFYPEIDAIQITKDKNSLITVNVPYNNYKRLVKKVTNSSATGSQNSWEVKPDSVGIVDNANAIAWNDVPVVYTYHRKISVTSGEKVEIHTTPVDDDDYYSVDTYMYLYKIDDPYHYSWTNDNSIGYHSKIEATLPAGDYYLVIRAKQSQYAFQKIPRQGLVNVYYNGNLLNEKVAISGYLINAPVKSTGNINFFTSQTSASPRLFLIDGDRMVFNSEPYVYYAPADNYWLEGTRKKITFRKSAPNWKILVTSIGAWGIYYGKCDIYGGLEDAPSKYMSKFPNLKSGDAILMAGDNAKYNSAAWAGGITDKNIWIGNSSKGSPYVWKSWDDYFGNNPMRYQGAITYKRNGRGLRSIIVYSKDSTMSGITHFAVMNKANKQSHGFDCESKIGAWGRITHTEKSLYGTEFGKTYYSYYEEGEDYSLNIQPSIAQKTNQLKGYTMEQSVNDGLSVLKNVELSPEEKKKADYLREQSSGRSFEKMYNKKIGSSLLADYDNKYYGGFSEKEYQDLVLEGRKDWKSCFGFLCSIIFSREMETAMDKDLASVLLCDIVAPLYASKMDSIKNEWRKNQYTEDGKYICPTVEYFTKLYIKSILENESADDFEHSADNMTDYDILTFNRHTIMVNLLKDAVVSMQIQNCTSNKSLEVIASSSMLKGKYAYDINSLSLPSGVYVCTLNINGIKHSMKFIKK